MLVVLCGLNNVTSHKLLHACYGILLDSFWHQTTDNFQKLFFQEGTENTAKIATPILLAIKMHIGPTRLLDNSAAIAEYDSEGRLFGRPEGVDWGDNKKIEEALAAMDKDEQEENPWKKNTRLKKEKMRKKCLLKKACQEVKKPITTKLAMTKIPATTKIFLPLVLLPPLSATTKVL